MTAALRPRLVGEVIPAGWDGVRRNGLAGHFEDDDISFTD